MCLNTLHFIIEETEDKLTGEGKFMFISDATVYTFRYLHVLLRLCLVFKETGTSRLSVYFLWREQEEKTFDLFLAGCTLFQTHLAGPQG